MLEPQPRERLPTPAMADGGADLPYVRLTQRRKPPRDRRSLWLLLAAVLAGHVLLVWLAYLILRPSPYSPQPSDVFRVTLIEPASTLPAPPPLVPPPPLPGQPEPVAPPRLAHREPPAPGAIRATLEGVPEPQLELYDSRGQIRLPPGAPPRAAPAYRTPALQGAPVLTIKTPLKYKPNPFNREWAPLDQSLGAKTVGRAFDKLVEKTTVAKTVHLPGGLKVTCGVSPLLLVIGCSAPPPPSAPPQALEDDIRLSMPPARTLTGNKVVLPEAASSAAAPAPARSG